MVKLRRIGLVSAGRVGFWFSMATNLVFLTIGIVMLIMKGVPVTRIPIEIWLRFLIMFTINAAMTSLWVGSMAFIYNVVASKFGGIQLEFEMMDSPAEKRKNGEKTVEVEVEETKIIDD